MNRGGDGIDKRVVLGIVGVAVVAVVVGILGGLTLGGGPDNVADAANENATATATAAVTPSPTPTPKITTEPATTTPTPSPTPDGPVSAASVEFQLYQRVNFHRTSQGHEKLPLNGSIREAARYHSEEMAQRGYLGYEGPGGETLADRLDRFGVDCRSSTETVGRVPFDTAVDADNGTTIRYDTPREVARAIVRGWMRGETSRSKILRLEWTEMAVGVAVDEGADGTVVYATLDLCET